MIGEKEKKILKRNLPRSRHGCPHCGHRHCVYKATKTNVGWFCGKCKKEFKGTETYTNKHGKVRVRAL